MNRRTATASALAAAIALVACAPAWCAPAPDAASAPTTWRATTQGGRIALRWNDDILRDLGLHRVGSGPHRVLDGGIAVAGEGGALRELAAGELRVDGEVRFDRDGATAITWRTARAVMRGGEAPQIDFFDESGEMLFYADGLMYESSADSRMFGIRSADLRIAPAFARRIGRARAAGLSVAGLTLQAPYSAASAPVPLSPGDPNWPGEPVPGVPGATYQADVFLVAFSGSYSRCGGCDGPGGGDAQAIFTPSATLSNNFNNGTPVAVVPGDARGTSNALYTADVPWYTKFTSAPNNPNFFYPYPLHDQHPYLVWNLYRLDPDGTIRQVGKSALKHAFSTQNAGAQCDISNGNNVLGRACADTYPEASNDENTALGPRSELIPATGQWGRCGSIYDPDCDGIQTFTPNTPFTNRMQVYESDIDPAANPGATWLFEGWYIVRDDVDIRNTMGTRPVSFTWDTGPGGIWFVDNLPPFRLGPAIDRWVAPGTATATARSFELATPEGNATVATRATSLGNGTWRYDYAVMNLDYSRSQTSGIEADHSFRVLSNRGFRRFTVALGSGTASQFSFADSDREPANDWGLTAPPGFVTWTSPFTTSTLDWGTLNRFSFVSNVAPGLGTAVLEPSLAGAPATYTVSVLAPQLPPLFADGFE